MICITYLKHMIVCVALVITAGVPAGVHAGQQPNIIFILADDLGYGDVGCYGQKKIRTPNIDLLARGGMRFTDHYSGQTVCTPSRASLLLGQHMGHCRIKGQQSPMIASDITVAMLLKEAGYTTGMIGKFGMMGAHRNPGDPTNNPSHPGFPTNKGFDHWFGFTNQGAAHFYYPDYLWRNEEKIQYPPNQGDIRDATGHYRPDRNLRYAHDLFYEEAVRFIRTNRDRPFFLYLPFAIPHAELAVPEDDPDLAYYRTLKWDEKPRKVGGGGKPGDAGYGTRWHDGYCAVKDPNATYAAMISRMDRSVGKLVALLKQLKIEKNTLVIFSSDNGPSGEGGQQVDFFQSSGPLRGGKRSIYEGGTRVPFIAYWPGTIQAGSVTSHQSGFNDFLPTACEIAGISPGKAKTDGVSYLPTLLGQPDKQQECEYRYFMWRASEAVRVGDWKLIVHGDDRHELFNLKEDIGEQNNLANQRPEVVARLKPYLKKAVQPL